MKIVSVVDQFLCNKQHNTPWSFSGLFKNVPSNVKITVLLGDPKISHVCSLENIPRGMKSLDARVLTGVGHSIPYERPDAILDAISLSRAKL